MTKRKYTVKPIYKRLMIPLLFVLITLFGSFVFVLINTQKTNLEESSYEKFELISNELEESIANQSHVIKSIMDILVKDPDLNSTLKSKKKELLLKKYHNIFTHLRENNSITHFYFHLPNRISLLRLHKPERDGDLTNRFTLRESERTGKTISGIELGIMGTFTLRVVKPIYDSNTLIGYLELGKEIEDILNKLHKKYKIELAVKIHKTRLIREHWEAGMKMLKRDGNWEQFSDDVIIYSSFPHFPSECKSFIDETKHTHSKVFSKAQFNNKEWSILASPLKNASNNVVGDLLIMNDISENIIEFKWFVTKMLIRTTIVILFLLGFIHVLVKRTDRGITIQQKKLSENETKYRTLFNSTGDAIMMLDEHGFIDCNPETLSVFGIANKEDFCSKHPAELSPVLQPDGTDSMKTANEHIAIAMKNGSCKFDWVHKRYDNGKDFPTEVLLSAMELNSKKVLQATLRDITERKRANSELMQKTVSLEKSNKALEKSRMAALSIMQDANLQKNEIKKALSDLEKSTLELKKLSRAIEHVPVSVIITDLSGIIEYINPSFLDTTGYTAEEVIGKNPRILKSGNVSKEFYSKMWETLLSQNIWRGEFENRKKNGELLWESASISPIINKQGKTTHFVAVQEDITKKKMVEQELKNAKIAAEVATEAKSRFLASMSHEIRTPMNAIIGFSHLTLNTNLNPKQFDYLNKIEFSAKALLGIINDILDFSKIEAGELTIENIDFDLEDVVTTVTNLISQKIFEKGLELVVHIDPNIPLSLIGDPLRLGQILTNFCNNAVKFTEKGEIIIEVSLIIEDEENVELLFAIKDTGIGIKEEQKDKLFKAFQQADASTTREFGGTGLGLVISENLANLMNGDIWFESKYKKGSTFYFSEKLKKQKIQRTNYNLLIEELAGTKVLLCDNNPTTNQFLSEVLETFSFRVKSVTSEQEAIASFAHSVDDPYKLVIADCRELEIENLDTLELIKNNYNVPIIMLVSPFLHEEVAETKAKEIVNSFLLKPFNYPDLFDAILELFGKEGRRKIAVSNDNNQYQEAFEKTRGSLILLVEDNEINQQLIVEMFKAIDIRVEIAVNGLEAVRMIKDSGTPSKYSLVLMDIQMPIMDGYAATREIKKLEEYESLPIIAMTADAMADVKNKCIKAGMVDYLTKPIEVNKVLQAMAKWIEPNKKLSIHNPEQRQNEESFEEIENQVIIPHIDGVNIDDGLKYVGNDKKLFMNLLQQFLNNVNFENKVKEALGKSDREEVVRLIHTLKGNAGLLGMSELRDAADKTQNLLLENKNLDIEPFLNEILEKLTPMLNSLKLIFVNEVGEVNSNINFLEDVENKLNELKFLLELHDSDAIELTNDIGSIIGFENEMVELKKTIENYQFEKALEILLKINNYE